MKCNKMQGSISLTADQSVVHHTHEARFCTIIKMLGKDKLIAVVFLDELNGRLSELFINISSLQSNKSQVEITNLPLQSNTNSPSSFWHNKHIDWLLQFRFYLW